MLTYSMQVFDRQPNEMDPNWAAFQRFRDIPAPRPTLKEFAETLGRTSTQVRDWATLWSWDARLLAWDQHLDAARQSVIVDSVEQMALRHIGLAQQAQKIVAKSMAKLLNEIEHYDTRLKPQEMSRMLDISVKLERLSKGESTEKVDGPDFSTLSNEDLLALEEIRKKARKS